MNDNDDDNDEDNDKAQRVIPSIIHAQDLHPAGEASSIRFLTELPKEKSDLVERSFLKARVGGHDADYLHPPPCRECASAITTGPSAKAFNFHPPDCFILDDRGLIAVVQLVLQNPPLSGVAGSQRATSIFLSTHPVARWSFREMSRELLLENVVDLKVAVQHAQETADQQIPMQMPLIDVHPRVMPQRRV